MNLLVARLNRDYPKVKFTFRLCESLMAYDAVLLKDGVDYALVEIKGRTGDGSRFPEWHIAKRKIVECKSAAAANKLEFFLIFSWSGVPFLSNSAIWPHSLPSHLSGRYDRGDAMDEEEMVLIPSKLFTKI